MEPFFSPTVAAPQTSHEQQIHWKQLWSLAALYASIIIGWIAYQNYQPRLLVQFQFTDFTFLLMAAQGIIVALTPLVAGKIGDRHRFTKGHRLPIISAGISFAAMVFMAVAFTLLGEPGQTLRWALPVLIVFWLVAMSIFTSPALSTIELFTPVDKLPRAMAVLTIVGNLVYSVEPIIVDVIDHIGAPLTFMLGGVAVFLSGYALKRNSLGLFGANANREVGNVVGSVAWSPYGFIFFLGLVVGFATTALFYLFPRVLHDKLAPVIQADGNTIVAGILFVSALISWPVSNAVNRYGMHRTFRISAVGILFATVGIYVTVPVSAVLLLTTLFTVAFTFLSISSLPLAIHLSAFREKVYCVGIFFSGVAIPEGLWEAYLAY